MTFALICFLLHLGIKKGDLNLFWYFVFFSFVLVVLMNIFLAIYYIKSEIFKIRPEYMTCSIISYSSSSYLALNILFIPILLVVIYSFYVLYISVRYLKIYPEEATTKLIKEIKFYPIIFLVTFTPKLIKHFYTFFYSEEIFGLFLSDKISITLLGTIVCFNFV